MSDVPTCPTCKIDMQVRKTMGGLQFICPNYHKCGGRASYDEWRKVS